MKEIPVPNPEPTAATIRDVQTVLRSNFRYKTRPDYIDYISRRLAGYPGRYGDPEYLRFFTRVSLMAAEFGFPESSGHIYAFLKPEAPKTDMLHPLSLLATAKYLAVITMQAQQQKEQAKAFWNSQPGISAPDTHTLLQAAWTKPRNAMVRFPHPAQWFDPHSSQVSYDRFDIGLPIYTPDPNVHEPLAALDLELWQIDSITRTDFTRKMLPDVAAAFAGIDIESVFLRDSWPADD